MDLIKIVDKKFLTEKIFNIIPENVMCEMYPFGKYNYEYLKDHDFILMTLENTNDNKIYTVLHGFPGDNPDGIIYDKNGKILDYLGCGCDPDTLFRKWYIEITDDCNDYTEFFTPYEIDNSISPYKKEVKRTSTVSNFMLPTW